MNGLWLSIYWEWKIISTDELHHFSEGWNNQPVNHWFFTDLYCRQWICWNCLLKFGWQPLVLLHLSETSWYHLISPHTLAHLFIILASVTYEVCVPRVFCTSEPHSRSCILPRRHATVWLRTPAGWQGVGRALRLELCIGWAARCASLGLESWKLPAEILGYQAIPNSKPLVFFNHQWSRKMCWTNAPVAVFDPETGIMFWTPAIIHCLGLGEISSKPWLFTTYAHSLQY